ncbi:MAG: DNA repair protein RecN [Chitinivibrionales bacterium]|nr:DNA repair protein RecN [Chitinivibrionales bacterium]
MLRELAVSNLALIHGASVEFDRGLNVLTGETGAGKSILMEAIGLLLGERAYTEQIRRGEDEAEVSGVFELAPHKDMLQSLLENENIPLEDGALIIRRRIQRSGRNRVYINQVPVPLNLLKQIGDLLVDLHGQHEHQSLLNPEAARQLIDTMPPVAPVAERYRQAYAMLTSTRQELDRYDRRAAELAERREIIEFQHRELTALALKEGEEPELEQQSTLLASATDRAEHAAEITRLLTDSDTGADRMLAAVHRRLQLLAKLDPEVVSWVADLESAQSVVSELSTFCESYLERIEQHADPARVEQVNERLARIQRLKKKYGCDADQLLAKQAQLEADLSSLENAEADRGELEKALERAHQACADAAAQLKKARQKAVVEFDKRVTAQMTGLGFQGGAWRTELRPLDEPGPHGTEDIELTVRTNPGEPFLPLVRTASGGEISRLMLAIKTILAERDRIPVLIFDEIDAGVGGTLAHEVARCLHELSHNHQVLCISHLHQIASVADHHYRVTKETVKGRNETRVFRLTGDEKVAEIARMLGGETEMARKHAEELLRKTK